MAKLQRVTTYSVAGDGLEIRYVADAAQKPGLTYQQGDKQRTFSGDEIVVERTRLGTIASVLLEASPDRQTVSFSLVLPFANRPSDAKSVKVETFAVRTTSRTSIAGPKMVEGQVEEYKLYQLHGNAW